MTDWNKYYKKPARPTSFTRKVSQRKIEANLKKYWEGGNGSICEIGGANSCFAVGICHNFDIANYHIVDSNSYGLELLNEKLEIAEMLSWELGDVLSTPSKRDEFDVVYSVGLIEHFTPEDTSRAIKTHFEFCVPGGLVLITFPTPTFLYRIIRFGAELTGQWIFTDERPLKFDEVLNEGNKFGSLLHQSINWKIGLTQGYAVWRKN
ncbi:class I SAM-dependent methyltransferase [Lentilitoribacter sp. Alg239-R112]|uniref:class I SAM-dependent methyltransferase n=1 Tax=Lentilitoribacter sp. Alg239-R112 TaxID=2305987 RepID=UPI0013A6E7DE|nr:class I SAM-dependent methyltransferase [Lentilitoribacter sp. Alg239-R112]